jgi:hypothetical protein
MTWRVLAWTNGGNVRLRVKDSDCSVYRVQFTDKLPKMSLGVLNLASDLSPLAG